MFGSASQKKTAVLIVGSLFLFGLGLFSGAVYTTQKFLSPKESIPISKVLDLYTQNRSSEISFDQFWDVWDRIQDGYVKKEVPDVDLFYGAIEGMVEGIGDPYSEYFPPPKTAAFVSELSGSISGIGTEIGIRDDLLKIIAPLPHSPAEAAGLRPGDTILAIDDEETFGMGLEEAVSKIRGPEGSTVVLAITRNGLGTLKEISIIRQKITIPSVVLEDVVGHPDIWYLQISQFTEQTWKEFDAAVEKVIASSPKGIVLDLRRNPGGFLTTSVEVASEWIPAGQTIVRERLKDGKETTYQSEGQHRLLGIPTVVLVDEGSASGAEILAGALQDYAIAKLVGNTTFGKGSVQDFEIFPDGSALKLTIAEWYTPLGKAIDGTGIVPDVVIEPRPEEKEIVAKPVKDDAKETAIRMLTQ